MKEMVYVEYAVANKADGKLIIENGGWFDSRESAKAALNKKYPSTRRIVTIKN